jgi:TonB family protein
MTVATVEVSPLVPGGAPVAAQQPLELGRILATLPPGTRRSPELLSGESALDEHEISRLTRSGEPTESDDGVEVVYTVDPELDRRVRNVLERKKVALGHVILMDPATGEVLSYVSTDPERFPATRPYPTASLMKVVTAAAALRNAPEAVRKQCRFVGSPWRLERSSLEAPEKGGQVNEFWRSLATSNNQCFARLAVDDVGEEALLAEMRRVGLLDPPGAHHRAGRVDEIESRYDLAQLGSGLAGSFITPLAAARLAALLGGGSLVHPFWISEVRKPDGTPIAIPGFRAPRPVWTDDVTRDLRELMVNVTARGTARHAFHDASGEPLLGPVRVAGKTGTLSGTDPAGRYLWFIGVAPAEKPSIAIATVVVTGEPGEASATQVAAETLRELFCADGACDAAHGESARQRAEERRLALGLGRGAGFRQATELDEIPHPVEASGFDFPKRLLRTKAEGMVVLRLQLDPEGHVLDAVVDHSTLPQFDAYVSEQVKKWRFSAPTIDGQAVAAEARLPIPIEIH